jgi:hypothetical protein
VIAILNADDPRVRAMADAHEGAVILAGRAEDANVRLLDERRTAAHRYGATISVDPEHSGAGVRRSGGTARQAPRRRPGRAPILRDRPG